MNADQIQEITDIVDAELDEAERIFRKHRMALDKALARADVAKAEKVPSRIPGHAFVTGGAEQVDTFIAFVADMRNSTTHLLCAIKDAKASELERVFYETSALLPALDRTIEYKNGSVTEYLGDGVLALFRVAEEDKGKAITNAYLAAEDCIGKTREIVNQALCKRYALPPLDIGIGMAMSRAVVSLVGLEEKRHAKVFGRCVYNATKLSIQRNQVYVDKTIDLAWPRTDSGQIRTSLKKFDDVDGYLVSRGTK